MFVDPSPDRYKISEPFVDGDACELVVQVKCREATRSGWAAGGRHGSRIFNDVYRVAVLSLDESGDAPWDKVVMGTASTSQLRNATATTPPLPQPYITCSIAAVMAMAVRCGPIAMVTTGVLALSLLVGVVTFAGD